MNFIEIGPIVIWDLKFLSITLKKPVSGCTIIPTQVDKNAR